MDSNRGSNEFSNYVKTSEARRRLGVSDNTLRTWADKGLVKYYRMQPSQQRMYDVESLVTRSNPPTRLGYACGKEFTERQQQLDSITRYMAAVDPSIHIVTDTCDPLNLDRPGLSDILERACCGERINLFVRRPDDLASNGLKLITHLITRAGGKVTTIEKAEQTEEDLTERLIGLVAYQLNKPFEFT